MFVLESYTKCGSQMCPKLDGFSLDPFKSVDEGSAVLAHSHRYISQNLGAVYSLNSSDQNIWCQCESSHLKKSIDL